MSNLSRLLIILILLVLCLTCCVPTTRRRQAPPPLPTRHKELMTLTYAYTTSIQGTNMALFAESTNKKISITFPGGKSPDIADVQKMSSLTPAANIPITITPLKLDKLSDKGVAAKTDSTGHLNLSFTFINGLINPSGWECGTPISWQTSSDNVIFPNGGAVLICEKYSSDQS